MSPMLAMHNNKHKCNRTSVVSHPCMADTPTTQRHAGQALGINMCMCFQLLINLHSELIPVVRFLSLQGCLPTNLTSCHPSHLLTGRLSSQTLQLQWLTTSSSRRSRSQLWTSKICSSSRCSSWKQGQTSPRSSSSNSSNNQFYSNSNQQRLKLHSNNRNKAQLHKKSSNSNSSSSSSNR